MSATCIMKTFTSQKCFLKADVYLRTCCSKLRVREAEFIDIPEIASLLRNLDGNETIWTIENGITNKRQHLAYVFMSGLSLVGIGILEPPEQINFIRAEFNTDPFHNHKYYCKRDGTSTGFATLKVVLAYSVFEAHFRYFAREMMRLSGSSALIWLSAYRNKWMAHKANSLACAMIPLMPRLSEINCIDVPELKMFNTLSKNIMSFATWFMNKKLTSVPKVIISTRIVIVGASRTAMSFLNTLIFGDSSSYLNFTSVTLVSPIGLPYVRHSTAVAEMMFPRRRTATDKYMKSVPYTYYVNVVHGTMVDMNEQAKYITLSNGGQLYYDLLFLLFGKQYQHPNYLKPLLERERTIKLGKIPPYVRLDFPDREELEYQCITNDIPDNVFIVNNIAEAHKGLKFVKNVVGQSIDYKILVYGTTIHAYCCLATLLEINIPAENIVFIEPFPPEEPKKTRIPVFFNNNVDQTVREVLDNLNVTVYRSYYFQSWTVGLDNLVSHIEFLSQFKVLRLDCTAFFYYGIRGVDTQAYVAINKSSVAYDGGILIDHQFRTKNPSIYAAGPVTAYYRKYYAGAHNHKQKYFDSYEIGEKLGTQIRNHLDPLFCEKKTSSNEKSVSFSSNSTSSNSTSVGTNSSGPNGDGSSSKISSVSRTSSDKPVEILPDLKKPIVIYCILPGGLKYLEVRSPGRKIPHHYVQSLQYNGFVLETFKNGYFKLHLNNDLVVDCITCLSPGEHSLENFKNIYGLSAVVLNNVHLRYTAKKIDDFYKFFRLPWAFFLYHDQADELFAMVKEILPKGKNKGETLSEALHSVAKQFSSPSCRNTIKLKIRTNFETSPHVEAITDYVVEWLSENDVLLPMYLQPSHTMEYSHDIQRNPVFKKRKRTLTMLMSTIL